MTHNMMRPKVPPGIRSNAENRQGFSIQNGENSGQRQYQQENYQSQTIAPRGNQYKELRNGLNKP